MKIRKVKYILGAIALLGALVLNACTINSWMVGLCVGFVLGLTLRKIQVLWR